MPHPAMLAAASAPAEEARQRLLDAALRLFAQRGYSRTSTRELAEAAKVNVAAISYYFGDKAGLYRAVFFAPMGDAEPDPSLLADPNLALQEALSLFFSIFLEPLRQGETARLCVKLRFREVLEPTGLWQEEIASFIRPMHELMVGAIARHFEVEPDDELHRLVVCITGLGVHLHVAQDVIDAVAPALAQAPDAMERWQQTLERQALAMVEAEGQRRGIPAGVRRRAA